MAEMAEGEKITGAEAGAEGPSEEKMRAQFEEEIRKVKVDDLVLQSLVSILNLTARRIAKDDERDLAQGKLGIDAALALVELIPDDAQAQGRQAVSELQLLYAKHAGEGGAPGEEKAPESETPGGENPK